MNKKELDGKLVDYVYNGQKGDDELEDHESNEHEIDEDSNDGKEGQDLEKKIEQSEGESDR